MNQNNLIYKGYRLTAKVVRGPLATLAEAPSGPVFRATVLVVPASAVQDPGDEYPVPCFDNGGFVYSPREAVHAAVCHGQHIVDGMMGVQS